MNALQLPPLTQDEEAAYLPFGPATRQKSNPLSIEIANEIRAVGGEIWLIQKLEYGLLLRCTVARRHARVVLPGPKRKSVEEPNPESNSRLHIVTTLADLRDFLNELTK